MRPSIFAIFVVAVTTAYFVNPNDAQRTLISELLPVTTQRVCQGNTVSFNCRTNGDTITMDIPNILQNQIFNVFDFDRIQECNPRVNEGVTCVLLDDGDNTTFTGSLTLYIQPGQNAGLYTVHCNASNSESNHTNSTAFIVDEILDYTMLNVTMLEADITFNCVLNEEDTSCTDMSTVSISWPSFDMVAIDHYIVTIDGKQYGVTQNSIIVSRSDGNLSVTIEAINSCGVYSYAQMFPASVDQNNSNSTGNSEFNFYYGLSIAFICYSTSSTTVLGSVIIALSMWINYLRKNQKSEKSDKIAMQ